MFKIFSEIIEHSEKKIFVLYAQNGENIGNCALDYEMFSDIFEIENILNNSFKEILKHTFPILKDKKEITKHKIRKLEKEIETQKRILSSFNKGDAV